MDVGELPSGQLCTVRTTWAKQWDLGHGAYLVSEKHPDVSTWARKRLGRSKHQFRWIAWSGSKRAISLASVLGLS